MVTEELKAAILPEPAADKNIVDEEEFFERELFEDILEMRSLRKVSEVTAIEFPKLQDQVYQCLYQLYQKNRGLIPPEKNEVFGIFELFFKNYYQHFRTSMEDLISRCSPVKVAYFLGKSSDKILEMLDQTILEIEKELA
jgi:adenylate cyclase